MIPPKPISAMEATLDGASALEKAGVSEPRLDGELLVCHALGWNRARLYAHPERILSDAEFAAWRSLLERRVRREPLPYLTGSREFYGREFLVNRSTLIPRPETELLVEGALRRRPWSRDSALGEERAGIPPLVADVGTGSGCIGLTLAAEVPQAILIVTDSSAEALAMAKESARRIGVADRVEFRHAAFPEGLDDVAGRLDLLVSNPPYVAESERSILPPEVRDYEPETALYAGSDGMALLRILLKKGASLLRPGGWIALEFGIGHANPLEALARDLGYVDLAVERDLADLPRALFARKPFL